jgi:hypothetical protein
MDKIFDGNQLLSFFCRAVIWTQPGFYYAYEHHLRDRGAYPWNGDSVAIPIFWNAILWCAWGPLLLRLIGRRFQRVTEPLRFLAWNGERSIFSVLVCVGALGFIALTADEIRHDLKWQNNLDLGYMGCWVVFWLVLRSLLLTKTADAEPSQADVENPQVE